MTTEQTWLRMSYGVAIVVSLTVGYLLLLVPIQITDSLVNIAALNRSFGDVLREGVQGGYFRPALWGALKAGDDASQGEWFYWFRTTQAIQVLLVLVLFAGLVRPRTASAAMAFALALAVVIGHHAFMWTVREAFPINTFLTILVCCAMAATLAFGRHRWWTDLAAASLFAFAAATVETGLLVGGIFLVCYALGLRGVSRNGAIAIAALIVVYFVFRFGVLDTPTPALNEREAGFGFRRYDGAEIAAMFTGREYVLFSYNVVASIVGTLFAEPRDGVWRLTRSFVNGQPDVTALVGVVSSTLATMLIGRYIWVRGADWRRRALQRDDQIVVLFLLVLAANAAISFADTKDVIMSPAGFFYAAAVWVACRHYLDTLAERRTMPGFSRVAHAAGLAIMLMLSVTWSIRALGLHASLTQTAYRLREQWAYVDDYLQRRYPEVPPRVQELKIQLQRDAVITHPQRPELRESLTTLFEMD